MTPVNNTQNTAIVIRYTNSGYTTCTVCTKTSVSFMVQFSCLQSSVV